MTYISLYRKWRSQNFDEIVGQKHIVQTLKNQVISGNIAHAYVFSGPRGVGKKQILVLGVNPKKIMKQIENIHLNTRGFILLQRPNINTNSHRQSSLPHPFSLSDIGEGWGEVVNYS